MPKHRARSCRDSRHGLGYLKRNIGSEVNISDRGCGRAVRDRIASAIDDVLSPAAGSEKANTQHQSTPVTASARAGFTSRSSMVCKASSRTIKSTEVSTSLEEELPKGPVTRHDTVRAV